MQANMYLGEKEVDQPPRVTASSEGEATIPGKPRIVIIEDQFLVAWGLQAMLRDLNFDVEEIANDAESGVDCAIKHAAELLFVDVNLGHGPDGIEAVRLIREYRKVSVIFITAYTDEANLGRIRQVAPDAPVLSKPVSPIILHSAIQKLFPTT